MAKVEDQSIPSEDRILYKRQCQIATTSRDIKYVRSRYPWRIPNSQAGGRDVTPGQITQRNRFLYVKNKYNTIPTSDKERWKDANPEYSSYLFGYNFFMLEGLSGGGPVEYPQMVKTIQILKEEVPTTGTKSYTINTVDPAKVVVLIQGNSYISDKIQRFSGIAHDNTEVTKNLSPNVNPAITEVKVGGAAGGMEISEGTGEGYWGDWYCSYLSASQVKIKLGNLFSTQQFGYYIEVIEHKAQTVYPVLVSVAANAVVIDWALVPSVAADVSITVVEYL